jgi:micrococcal nuclease
MKRLPLIFMVCGILIIGTILGIFLSQTAKLIDKVPEQNQSTSEVISEKTSLQSPASALLSGNRQTVKVVRVIDGDTIEIEGDQKVRYIGIDTPETVHPDKAVQCFGKESTSKNKELVEGKIIELEKDISETDKYNRLLRYVFIDKLFVNDYLVREGYAHASSYPPDVKYQEQLQEAEQEARGNNRGLWGECQSKENQTQLNQSASDSSCTIKGNISSSGEKIYHMPDQYYYEKTVIDQSNGERWFCTEEEAIAAGWRKSKK